MFRYCFTSFMFSPMPIAMYLIQNNIRNACAFTWKIMICIRQYISWLPLPSCHIKHNTFLSYNFAYFHYSHTCSLHTKLIQFLLTNKQSNDVKSCSDQHHVCNEQFQYSSNWRHNIPYEIPNSICVNEKYNDYAEITLSHFVLVIFKAFNGMNHQFSSLSAKWCFCAHEFIWDNWIYVICNCFVCALGRVHNKHNDTINFDKLNHVVLWFRFKSGGLCAHSTIEIGRVRVFSLNASALKVFLFHFTEICPNDLYIFSFLFHIYYVKVHICNIEWVIVSI